MTTDQHRMDEGEQEMLVPRHRRHRVFIALLVFLLGIAALTWASNDYTPRENDNRTHYPGETSIPSPAR